MRGLYSGIRFRDNVLRMRLAHVNCTHSVKVVECVQIVWKMQASILHAAFNTMYCFLLYSIRVVENIITHLSRAEESVALWTQNKKLLHGHRIQFVLEESERILRHISIDIICLNGICQTICIREQYSQLTST